MEGEEVQRYGLRTMVGLCLLNTVSTTQLSGITNTWGVVVIYVASYLHLYDQTANLSNLEMSYAVQSGYWCLGLRNCHTVIGSLVFSRYGGRVVLFLGVIVLVAPLLICSFLESLCPWLGLYYMSSGMGACLVCMNSIWVSWQWYPKRKGLATGFVMFFYGASSAIQGMFFTLLMNPNNQRPDLKIEVGDQEEYLFSSDIARRLPMTLRVTAALFAVVGGVSLLMIRERGMSGEERKSLVNSIASKESKQPVHCPDLKTALKTSSFYVLACYSFTSYCYVGFALLQYKNYAMTKSKNDQLLSLIGSVGFICNTITRFLVSVLMDYITFRSVSIVVMSLQIVLAATIHWVVAEPLIYMIWVSLTFICFAAVFSPVTIVCGDIYGPT